MWRTQGDEEEKNEKEVRGAGVSKRMDWVGVRTRS